MDVGTVSTSIGAIGAILVAGVTYYLGKAKDREAELRSQKFLHYKELIDALNGIVGSDPPWENQRRWARAANTLALVASQEVLSALTQFQEATKISAPQHIRRLHDERLATLLLAIRTDLAVQPRDNQETFDFTLWNPDPQKSDKLDSDGA